MALDNVIVQIGRYSMPVRLGSENTLLIGGFPGKASSPEIITINGRTEMYFEGEKIPLPGGNVSMVRFPYPQIIPAEINKGIARCELIVHINGKTEAGAYWQSENVWSQYGFTLPTYLGQCDLAELIPEEPVSGKGLSLLIKNAGAPATLPLKYAEYPSKINEQILDVDFPHWNNSIFSFPLRITTADAIYEITRDSLPYRECLQLIDRLNGAIRYHSSNEHRNPQIFSKLKDIELSHIKKYTSQFSINKR